MDKGLYSLDVLQRKVFDEYIASRMNTKINDYLDALQSIHLVVEMLKKMDLELIADKLMQSANILGEAVKL